MRKNVPLSFIVAIVAVFSTSESSMRSLSASVIGFKCSRPKRQRALTSEKRVGRLFVEIIFLTFKFRRLGVVQKD